MARILLVEDDTAICDAIAYSLRACGYDVEVVGGGEAAPRSGPGSRDLLIRHDRSSARVNQPLVNALSRAAMNRERARQLARQTERLRTETQALRQAVTLAWCERLPSPARRDLLQRSERMRLMARLATMPVIEQAKGIIIAQSHCGEFEAFDLLRRASQRSNMPVRDLAARIVAAETGQNDGPIDRSRGTRTAHAG